MRGTGILTTVGRTRRPGRVTFMRLIGTIDFQRSLALLKCHVEDAEVVSMRQAAHSGKALIDTRRIVVVGPCASGKSTLTSQLTDLGFDARVCGQEHSAIPHLWKRLRPDVLIALDVDLDTLRARRHQSWSEGLYLAQRARLLSAFHSADLSIDSSAASTERVVATVLAWIEGHPIEQVVRDSPDRLHDQR